MKHPSTIVTLILLALALVGCSKPYDSATQRAITASKEIGLHEAMVVGCEQIEPVTPTNLGHVNVHAYNKAFHFEAQAHGRCAVTEGTIGTLHGDELRVGDQTYDIWVSFEVK